MLNWTERIIRMRKEVPEIGWGDFTVIATRDPAVLDHPLRLAQQLGAVRAQSRREPREIAFSVGLARRRPASCWSTCSPRTTAAPTRRAGTQLVLEGYGYRWYRVGGLDYLLKRSDIDRVAAGKGRKAEVRGSAFQEVSSMPGA